MKRNGQKGKKAATSPEYQLVTPLQPNIQNPTLQQIAEVVNALPAADPDVVSNHSDYLIINKLGEDCEQVIGSYMQSRPVRGHGYAGMFLVEYRDSKSARHYKSYVEAGAPLLAVFESYLKDDGLWRELAVWRDISFQFEDLRALLPPEEFAASFFPDGEWEAGLETKKQHDEKFWKQLANENPQTRKPAKKTTRAKTTIMTKSAKQTKKLALEDAEKLAGSNKPLSELTEKSAPQCGVEADADSTEAPATLEITPEDEEFGRYLDALIKKSNA